MRGIVASLGLSLLVVSGAAVAGDGPAVTGEPMAIAKYRHESFEALGKHMKATSLIVKGEVAVPAADLTQHATALHLAATSMAAWFPPGTGPDSKVATDALQKVWTDAAGFEAKRADFEAASATLVEKAKANDVDGFKAAFKDVGGTCKACHDGYRKEEH